MLPVACSSPTTFLYLLTPTSHAPPQPAPAESPKWAQFTGKKEVHVQ